MPIYEYVNCSKCDDESWEKHMPIYEYRCLKCEEDFETLVFRSNDEVACPHCKGEKVKRLMSACGFKSKGSGVSKLQAFIRAHPGAPLFQRELQHLPLVFGQDNPAFRGAGWINRNSIQLIRSSCQERKQLCSGSVLDMMPTGLLKDALILGGVEIPYPFGLEGHSDADVLTHAVIDAIIGALGVGDIGQHFPDTDPDYKGADSLSMLRTVWTG